MNPVRHKRRIGPENIGWIVLIALVPAIKIVSFFPDTVEKYYSRGVYPVIGKFQRILWGWLPFSAGDLLYVLVVVLMIRAVISFIKKWRRRQLTRMAWWKLVKKVLFTGIAVYVCFNVFWGLNYNRLTVSEQFGLDVKKEAYSVPELEKLVLLLKDSLNALDASGRKRGPVLQKRKLIFREAAAAYKKAGGVFPLPDYQVHSVKPSLFSYLCNYTGISGYYNPFTGEAQVNTTIPAFLQPFVTCHEIGHQMGYGKEDEANFAGFLSASHAEDPVFRYSAYFDMYAYARRALFRKDSLLARSIHEALRPGVKADIETVKKFYARYESALDEVMTLIYGQYLKANEQPEGIRSYNEVVGMLIAYYSKQGLL